MPKLLIRLPNWVGDVVMTLPAIQALQQQGVELKLIGRPWISKLLSSLNLELFHAPRTKIETIQFLKKFNEQHILLFPNSFTSASTSFFARKQSVGFANNFRSPLLAKAVSKPQNHHETDVFNLLAKQAYMYFFKGETFEINSSIPHLPIHPRNQTATQKLLKQNNIPESYVVICPFAHGLSPEKLPKKWPYWQALIKQLNPNRVIICPGGNELLEAKMLYPEVHILENLQLDDYASILSQAQLVLANDSGPMHISAATQTPTIALFGATCPKRTGPRNAIIMGELGRWPTLEEVLMNIKAQAFEWENLF